MGIANISLINLKCRSWKGKTTLKTNKLLHDAKTKTAWKVNDKLLLELTLAKICDAAWVIMPQWVNMVQYYTTSQNAQKWPIKKWIRLHKHKRYPRRALWVSVGNIIGKIDHPITAPHYMGKKNTFMKRSNNAHVLANVMVYLPRTTLFLVIWFDLITGWIPLDNNMVYQMFVNHRNIYVAFDRFFSFNTWSSKYISQ